MREIKFRALRKKDKKIIELWEDDLYSDGDNTLFKICEEGYYGTLNKADMSDKYELMQYTGLKDKNGKEIYEGDLVKNKGGLIGIIEWLSFGWYMRWVEAKGAYPIGQEVEVIGNIHERH